MPMVVCKDPECRAHGPMVKRIQRLQRAVANERAYVVEIERALEINSDAVRRLRRSLTRAWGAWLAMALEERLEDGTPVLKYVMEANPGLRERLEAALDKTKDD